MPNGLPAMFGADPLAYQQMRLGQQQLTAQNAMAMAPGIYAGPNVFAPQPAAPSPAGGPRPPMPGQASTPAPAPAPAQAPIPPYKAMPGTPGAASTSAPVSLPPKPAPQPAAPQSAAAASASAPSWAQPTFQPVDIATAEQQFYANPQLQQQAMARRDYLIAQGIPKVTAESWVNEEVGKLWGLQQQALDHQNDQYVKFAELKSKEQGQTFDRQLRLQTLLDNKDYRAAELAMKEMGMGAEQRKLALGYAKLDQTRQNALQAGGAKVNEAINQMHSDAGYKNFSDKYTTVKKALVDIADSTGVATPQLQADLMNLMPKVRATNQMLHMQSGFGDAPTRLQNAVTKFLSGHYQEADKKFILDYLKNYTRYVLDPQKNAYAQNLKDATGRVGGDLTNEQINSLVTPIGGVSFSLPSGASAPPGGAPDTADAYWNP